MTTAARSRRRACGAVASAAVASAAVAAVAVALSVCHASSAVDDQRPADLRGAPAVVVGVRHKDGRHDVKGYGALEDGRGAPDGDTVFELGSLTKTFTALLYARALVEKRVSTSTTLGDMKSVPASATAARITLESLATHSSGLPRSPPNAAPAHADDPWADYGVDAMKSALTSSAISCAPCSHEYSNFGMGALGYALTSARGGYAKALTDDVIAPLGLAHTRFLEVAPGSRFATPHDGGRAVTIWHQTEATAGAGGLFSTANDLLAVSDALIASALVDGNVRAHEDDGNVLAHGDDGNARAHEDDGHEDAAPMAAALGEVQRVRIAPGVDKTRANGNGEALAWSVRCDGVLWMNGGTGGTTTVWDVDARSGCAIVILVNEGDWQEEHAANRVLDECRREASTGASATTTPPSR